LATGRFLFDRTHGLKDSVRELMSPLGQKLPRSLGAVVSALPPKADADPRAEGVN
jgi:hypothetical protein